ncbi:hypothetical protein GJAV_G00271390 [Gymnothorax javanicus]|nr:hypothetical protein GJAV_G00271390 [Gymnothorax javanicus]
MVVFPPVKALILTWVSLNRKRAPDAVTLLRVPSFLYTSQARSSCGSDSCFNITSAAVRRETFGPWNLLIFGQLTPREKWQMEQLQMRRYREEQG